MKKFLAVTLASLMLLAAAGCKSNAPGVSSSPSASSSVASGASVASGTNASSSSSAAGQQTASAPLKGALAVPKAAYKVQWTSYLFAKGAKNFKVKFPQISGTADDAAVNALLKQTAMKTVQSIGTANTSSFAEVTTVCHVTYNTADLLSAEFEETSRTSKTAVETRAYRTVNYDLKNSRALSTSDLVQQNSALNAAVKAAVQKHVSSQKRKLITDSVIASGVKTCSVCFKPSGFVIELPVPAAAGDYAQLTMNYPDTSGFHTDSAVWSYFIKK